MPKGKHSKGNSTLETLLNLDGEIFPMENGYWTKFEASKVEPALQIPHGVKYALTLHDQNNTRVLGLTMHMHLSLKRRNMVLVRLPGTINIR